MAIASEIDTFNVETYDFGQEVVDALRSDTSIGLTPCGDDGNSDAGTFLIQAVADNAMAFGPSVSLLDLVRNEFSRDSIYTSEDPRRRMGFDRQLEGFVDELEKCLAIVGTALRRERAKGIQRGDWEGTTVGDAGDTAAQPIEETKPAAPPHVSGPKSAVKVLWLLARAHGGTYTFSMKDDPNGLGESSAEPRVRVEGSAGGLLSIVAD